MKFYRTSLNKEERLLDIPVPVAKKGKDGKITLNPKALKQTIIGFGGAFTESAAYNLSRISKENREKAIKAYFDPKEGIGYTIGRVSIHGCDFSLGSYLYIDDYDDTLKSFNISRDQKIIDLIHDAQKYTKEKIQILGSPWTPPYWMKDNNSPIRGGKLLPKYYQTWADYFVKFIKAYEEKNVKIEWVSVQNEPQAVQRWDSCIYDHEDEKNFVKVLGSTLEKEGLKDKKILIWDHNRDVMVARAKAIYEDKEASKYVWGTAFHWYDNEQFDEVKKHKDLFPDKHLIFSEGCQEGGPHFGEYKVGERYGRNMINDLRNGTEAYIDWNLYLDETGGPNHVNNLCSAPFMIKIFHEELIQMISYYYIGHFSKFIKPGARQMESSGLKDLLYLSCINPDGTYVLVIQNEHEKSFDIEVEGLHHEVFIHIEPRSIQTIVL